MFLEQSCDYRPSTPGTCNSPIFLLQMWGYLPSLPSKSLCLAPSNTFLLSEQDKQPSKHGHCGDIAESLQLKNDKALQDCVAKTAAKSSTQQVEGR